MSSSTRHPQWPKVQVWISPGNGIALAALAIVLIGVLGSALVM